MANYLDSLGDRVQNSVFELVMSQSMLEQCLDHVKGLIDLQEDKVAAYFICGTCASKRMYLGVSDGICGIGNEQVFIV